MSFVLPTPKDFKIIWLSNLLIISVSVCKNIALYIPLKTQSSHLFSNDLCDNNLFLFVLHTCMIQTYIK